jgi:hypothetical protein
LTEIEYTVDGDGVVLVQGDEVLSSTTVPARDMGASVNASATVTFALGSEIPRSVDAGRIKVRQRMKFKQLPYDVHRSMTRELRG